MSVLIISVITNKVFILIQYLTNRQSIEKLFHKLDIIWMETIKNIADLN